MASITGRNSLSARNDSMHPREYEHQATYRAYLFGQFRLFCGTQLMNDLLRRRTKAGLLLQWFLLNPGKLCSADEFIDLFWPDASAETAMGNFHVTMHYLRRVLEPTLDSRQEPTYIRRKLNNFYWFQMDERWWIDASDVQTLFERARACDQRGEEQRAAFYYRKVAGYCSQGFLAGGNGEGWLRPYARRYTYIYAQVLARLIQIYMQEHMPEEVLEYAYQLLFLEPCHEEATQVIIDIHLQQGNISLAQQRLDEFRQASQRELGSCSQQKFHTLRERIRAASR